MVNIQPKIQKTAENCEKPHLPSRKTAGTAPPFVQNKPKVKSPQIKLTAFITSTCAQMDNWLNAKNKPNQTQFKPNTNPTPKIVINPYIASAYTRKPPSGGKRDKPKTNPTDKMNISTYYTVRYIMNTAVMSTKTNPNKANSRTSIRRPSFIVARSLLLVISIPPTLSIDDSPAPAYNGPDTFERLNHGFRAEQ
jgi:hypothetical protein